MSRISLPEQAAGHSEDLGILKEKVSERSLRWGDFSQLAEGLAHAAAATVVCYAYSKEMIGEAVDLVTAGAAQKLPTFGGFRGYPLF